MYITVFNNHNVHIIILFASLVSKISIIWNSDRHCISLSNDIHTWLYMCMHYRSCNAYTYMCKYTVPEYANRMAINVLRNNTKRDDIHARTCKYRSQWNHIHVCFVNIKIYNCSALVSDLFSMILLTMSAVVSVLPLAIIRKIPLSFGTYVQPWV